MMSPAKTIFRTDVSVRGDCAHKQADRSNKEMMNRYSLQESLQLFLIENQHGICISLPIFLQYKK
jgi:hypothetical protein